MVRPRAQPKLVLDLALTLSVGVPVDDSIVVSKKIARHVELDEPPLRAPIRGGSEISMTAITIIVVDVAEIDCGRLGMLSNPLTRTR